MSTYNQSYSVYDGQSWSGSIDVTSLIPDNLLNSVACTASTFCIATTSNGFSIEWDGTTWSVGPRFGSPGLSYGDSVHCASSTLCWTQGGQRWDGTTWTSTETGSGGVGMDQMSCASVSFCVHTDFYGAMTAYVGGQWTPMAGPWTPGTQDSDVGVACPTTTFCVSVAQAPGSALETLVSTYNGTSWSTPATLHPKLATNPLVACPTSTLCFELDIFSYHSDEQVSTLSNGSWSAPTLITPANYFADVSCVPGGICHGLDYAGNVRTYDGTTWSSPTVADAASGALAISCATENLCAIVDDGGGAVVETGGTWGTRQVLTAGAAFTSVSCTADGACMALTNTGVAEHYKNGQWSTISQSVSGVVACGSANYCVASAGSASQWWNGSAWTPLPSSPFGTYITPATCPGPTDCVVTLGASFGQQPRAAHFVNGVWQATAVPIGSVNDQQTGRAASSVACVGTSFCVADVYGRLNTFSGNGFSEGPARTPTDAGLVSCASPTMCVLVNNAEVFIGR